MKLVDHFRKFMQDTVNLNATRITLLDDSVESLTDVLDESDWEPNVREYVEQGSWAHRTIIKPVDGKAFDADLIVLVDPVPGWDAKAYVTSLRAVFADHGTYKDKVRRWSHCITIEYSGERNIDVAPCVVGRNGVPGYEVCNLNSNSFERSEPEKYTEWLIARNAWTGGNALRKVTRLHKYLRDVKSTFTCPSILLTTLLGQRISVLDASNQHDFADVPTALRAITARLDDWLQLNSTRPAVLNPVLSSEDLGALWDDDTYSNFREKFHTYRTWIDDAFGELDRDESIGKWRRVFGDEFASDVVLDKASKVTETARRLMASGATIVLGLGDDLVELFQRVGRRALPPEFDRLPHKRRPPWRSAVQGTFAITVVASRHATRNGQKRGDFQSGDGPLSKAEWLLFRVRTSQWLPLGGDYEVQWRVTNTDQEASREKCLRGEFYEANDGNDHWEETKFRGVHSVEAFVLRRRDKFLVAQSAPFYVVIQ